MKLVADPDIRILVNGEPRGLWRVASKGPQRGQLVWVKKGIRYKGSVKLTVHSGLGAQAVTSTRVVPMSVLGRDTVEPHELPEVTVKAEWGPAEGFTHAEQLPESFGRANRMVVFPDGTWGMIHVFIGDTLEIDVC